MGLRSAELLQMAAQFLHLLRIPGLGLDISFHRQGLGVQTHTEKYKSSAGSVGSACKTKVCLAERMQMTANCGSAVRKWEGKHQAGDGHDGMLTGVTQGAWP